MTLIDELRTGLADMDDATPTIGFILSPAEQDELVAIISELKLDDYSRSWVDEMVRLKKNALLDIVAAIRIVAAHDAKQPQESA